MIPIEPAPTRGPLIVLSGPSGVGKSTVVAAWLERTRWPLRRAITATSRPPRPGEREGRDYYFWSPEVFAQAIHDGKMLEHARVHGGDFYGTPKAEVEPYCASGRGVVLVIDVQGAAQVRASYQHAYDSIFLLPPDWETLETRLRRRGTEDPERIERRLASAKRELAAAPEFHWNLINDDLERTILALEQRVAQTWPQKLPPTDPSLRH